MREESLEVSSEETLLSSFDLGSAPKFAVAFFSSLLSLPSFFNQQVLDGVRMPLQATAMEGEIAKVVCLSFIRFGITNLIFLAF